MTVFEAYNSTKKKLQAAGIEDFVFEAKQIIKHITGLSAAQILANYNNKLSQYQEDNLTVIIRQREIRYPLQYIFGEWDFYGRSFKVGPGVLCPRADTETLVEHCLEYIKKTALPRVLDLCAGSGCIGITIAKENEAAEVTLLEKFPEALRYAEQNIKLNQAAGVRLIEGDVLEGSANDQAYDLIVSNPPYIPPKDMETVSPETKFEPETALIGGDDGLDFYRAIIENYKQSLTEGGMLAFEVGINQYSEVSRLLEQNGFKDISVVKDMGGVERVVSGIK